MLEGGEDVALIVACDVGIVADHGDKFGKVEELSDEHVVAIVHVLEVGLCERNLFLSSSIEDLGQRRLCVGAVVGLVLRGGR